MMENKKREDFFGQLRKIAQTTERGVQQLQTEFENKHTNRCAATALTKLIDLKKNSKELKNSVRQETEKLKKAGDDYEKLLSLTTSLIDIENHKLSEILVYMKQYGYTPKECSDSPAVTTLKEDTQEKILANTECTPPHSGTKTTESKTPKLEDFGLSQLTMRAINRAEKESRYGNARSMSLRIDDENQVPSIFHHNGLMCTPSVLDGRYASLQTPLANGDTIGTDVGMKRPTTPEFLTPYTKKLMQKDKQLQMQKEMDLQSPSNVVFKPSGQQGVPSMRNHLLKTPPKMASLSSEMPETPEMTCKFETFTDVTHSYNNVTKPATEEISSKQSKATFPLKLSGYRMGADMPQTPELTCNFKNFTSNISPMQTMHMTEISKPSKVPSPVKLSGYSTGLAMPPSPELTCNFQSMKENFSVEEPEILTEKFGTNKLVTPELPESLTESRFKGTENGHRSLYPSTMSPPRTPQFLCSYK